MSIQRIFDDHEILMTEENLITKNDLFNHYVYSVRIRIGWS